MSQSHLLVCDDEPSVLAVIRLYLERQGYKVTCARNGDEALELAGKVAPDLILMDIQMPGKSGIDAVKELRVDPAFQHVPIIGLTGHVQDYDSHQLVQAGFTEMVYKPFQFAELHEIVVYHLTNKQS
ncbi:MAG: response regulator [Chloroflexaceae bacterium]|nr:response regulator [Chloroflexaceae bacterium]